MKVLLISANTLQSPYPVYPLGLDYVAAALRSRHQVEIIDRNLTPDDASLERAVERFAPEVIGLGLRNVDNTDLSAPQGFMADYEHLVSRLRHLSPAPIVLGGPGFSIFPGQIMAHLEADYGVVGEGEAMGPLVDALAAGQSPVGLAGILVAHQSKTPPRNWSQAVERISVMDQAHTDFYVRQGGMLNLQTKRGCPFKCVYCTYPHIEGRQLRNLDPTEVARTALDLQSAGAKYLFLTDSAFNADIDHSLAVAQQFREVGLTVPWGAFFAPLKLPDGYFEQLAQAGLTHVEFGSESLSDRVLKTYGKPFDREQIFQAHQAARQAGLYVAHYLLLGGPGETPDTVATTLSEAQKLSRTVIFWFCGMRLYPHTPLYRQALAEHLITPDEDLLKPYFYRSPGIGDLDLVALLREKGVHHPNWVIGAGDDGIGQTLSRMYDKGFSGPLWEFLIR